MAQKLSDIAPGKCAAVCGIVAEESMARRLMDIGMVQGTEVECLMKSLGRSRGISHKGRGDSPAP